MNKNIFFLILIIMIVGLLKTNLVFSYTFSGGDGSNTNPFHISSCLDLDNMDSGSKYANFTLTQDINCSGYNNYSCAWEGWDDFDFYGEFNGNGHIIYDLLMTDNTYILQPCGGMIGENRGFIHDIGLDNFIMNVQNPNNHIIGGSIVRYNYGNMTRFFARGKINHTINLIPTKSITYGGLIGSTTFFTPNSVSDCWVDVTPYNTGSPNFIRYGGIFKGAFGTIDRCYSRNSTFNNIATPSSFHGVIGAECTSANINNVYAPPYSSWFAFGTSTACNLVDTGIRSKTLLHNITTYNNYDFNNTWYWDNETQFPHLRIFLENITIPPDNETNITDNETIPTSTVILNSDLAESILLLSVHFLYIILFIIAIKTDNIIIYRLVTIFGIFISINMFNDGGFYTLFASIFGLFNGYLLISSISK